MDMSDKSNSELEKRNDGPSSYNAPGMSGDWRFNDANFASSSGAMVDSFGQPVWEHPVNPASLGFSEMNVHGGGGVSGMFVPSMSGMLAQSLSQFPADSAFIERAARFSSFSGGHFGELLNPFGVHQSVNPYLQGGGTVMQGPQEVLSGNSMKSLPYRQPQKSDVNVTETSKDVSVAPERGAVDRVSPKNGAKQRVSMSGNDSDEPEHSASGTREDASVSPAKSLGAKKRKRVNQDAEFEQANGGKQDSGDAGKKPSEIQHKVEQNPASAGNKSDGKQNSQNSDPQKEEYIHVRARRGQATNSHSLAERVRREKISERMKFLQDLVPGCSKVIGKAVMLDEIINYVQSLQRQVEDVCRT